MIIFQEYQNCHLEEEHAQKEFEVAVAKKNNLEDLIFKKLEEKVLSDKTAQYVNNLLIKAKNAVLEHEMLVVRTENMYGNNLLELEVLTNFIENQKLEFQELLEKGSEKEKQIDELQKEIRKCETTTGRRHRKLLEIHKVIEQVVHFFYFSFSIQNNIYE